MIQTSQEQGLIDRTSRSRGPSPDLPWAASVVETLEREKAATWAVAGLVAIAGAGRGVTPGFEAGWIPLVGHAVAGLVIWLSCTGLVWNVAHRIFGYSETYFELARVFGLPAIPILGLWLNASATFSAPLWFNVAVHAVAFIVWIAVTRVALRVTYARAIAIVASSMAIAIFIIALLGIFLIGTPTSGGA